MGHQRHDANQVEDIGEYIGKLPKLQQMDWFKDTCNSLMATQELDGNPCNIGTKNWRHPDQWPISIMTQTKLKIRMKTPKELKNCSCRVR